jgi:hypothetical protein
MEPAAMTLTFATPSSTAGVTSKSFIDLSQVASLVNRRFYRQGINWAVGGFKVSSLKAGTVTLGKLPSTWVMSNAWEKGFRTWQRMNDEALAESDSMKPRFLDFKIYANSDHHAAGFDTNLKPFSFTGDTADAGEWEPSKVYIPTGTAGTQGQSQQRELLAVGANYPGISPISGLDAVSLIEGYAASRGLPNVLDPNAPDDGASVDGFNPQNWLTAIFNEGTEQKEEILEDMVGPLAENNIAPYPFENDGVNGDTMYPGGAQQMTGLEYHDLVNIYETNVTDGIGIQRLKGGMFPCGLIAVHWTPSSASANLVIQIDLVPGSHRGYLCEPMTDM